MIPPLRSELLTRYAVEVNYGVALRLATNQNIKNNTYLFSFP